MRIRALVLLLVPLLPLTMAAAKKKKKAEVEVTQTLELPPDPPAAVTADTARLTFLVSPLSGKGLLSQQVRDGIKALRTQAKGGQIVKIRAFVAGTGDLRRVQTIVSEQFADKKQPVPALATVQVGLLPLDGAQVVLEAAVEAKKPVNPAGLGYLSGMGGGSKAAAEDLLPMLDKAIGDLSKAARLAGSEPADMQRVTCLLSSLGPIEQVRTRLAAAFPAAAQTNVQIQRAHGAALAECEGVVRLRKRPAEAAVFVRPPDMNPSPAYSKFVLVGSDRIVLTGTQMAFHSTEQDVRLAFQRMAKALEGQKSTMRHVVFSSLYPLTDATQAHIRKVRSEFYHPDKPPASTMLLYEGLPSMDASMALELVAVPE